MEEQKPSKVCVHCRAELEPKQIHWDHIPPKNLFPSGTTGIIQVPACRKCNNPDSKDDEYFRLLAIHISTESNPSATAVNAVNVRAITREGAKGFRKALARKTKPVILETETGLFAGKTSNVQMDIERLNRTAMKIARGLYYHHKGHPVPEGFVLLPNCISNRKSVLDENRLNQLVGDFEAEFTKKPLYEIGKNTFHYRIGFFDEGYLASIVAFLVYEWAEFLVIILPQSAIDEARKEKAELEKQ